MAEVISLKPLNTPAGRRDPYPFYAQLHQLGAVLPVAPRERYDVVIHGYDAVSQALRDPALRVVDSSQQTYLPSWDTHRAQAVFMNSMFFTNAPRHTVLRRLVSQEFTARRTIGLGPAVQQLTGALLDRMAERAAGGDPVDFMAEFAFPLPANVLGELLGVPDAEREWYRPRARALGVVLEFGGATPDNIRKADEAAVELTDFFARLAELRRAEPRDDLISALVRGQDAADEPLTEHEFLANLIVIFNAGFVSTTHLFGNGLTLLLEQPELLDRLRAAPELTPGYVEEMLRFEGPLHFAARWAAADTEVAGVPIAQGSRIVLLTAAANRDPKRFVDPDRFDPGRVDNQTLAFGGGPHYCLGAALARLEGLHGFTMLLDRFARIEFAVPPEPLRQLTLRGHDELWVRLG